MFLVLLLLAAIAIWIAGTALWGVAFDLVVDSRYTWRRTGVASAVLFLAVLAVIPISIALDDDASGANLSMAFPFVAAMWLVMTGLAAIPLFWVIARVVRGGSSMPTRTHRSVGADRTRRTPTRTSLVDRSR